MTHDEFVTSIAPVSLPLSFEGGGRMTTWRPEMDSIKASALAHPRFKANPYPFYARMRAESPIFPASVPFVGRGWIVTRYEDVVTVAKDDRSRGTYCPWCAGCRASPSCP